MDQILGSLTVLSAVTIVSLAIFLAIRQLVHWYFKIDRIVELLEKIAERD